MFLKRLELGGFKSFAAKSILEFPRGISVIVGPNGSGKSNIADAIRWALGEQSMKSIRTGRSEELIFAGTPKKTAANLAQVSVYFDNSDKFLPSDLSRVGIARKLYRSGESEYFLNKEPARLKDIVAFLARARLGVRGFCVVSQGAADAILSSSSREKREIIEEALGLKEFQLKKQEAKRKIDETKINLDKATSMIQEIAPHLRYLKRQVNKFEKRSFLENELKELQKQYFSRELSNHLNEWQKTEEEKSRVLQNFQAQKAELDQFEETAKKEEERTPRYFEDFEIIKGKIGGIQEEKNKLLRELGKIEGLIEAESNRPAATAAQKTPIDPGQVVERLQKIREILAELLEYESLEEIKLQIREIAALIEKTLSPEPEEETAPAGENVRLASLEKGKNEIAAALQSINREIETLNASFRELREKNRQEMEAGSSLIRFLEKKRKEIDFTENVLRNLEIAEAKLKIREEDLRAKIREAQIVYDEIAELCRNPEAVFSSAEPAVLEEKIFKIKRELGEIGAIDEELLKEYRETNERYEFLSTQSEDLKNAVISLNKLIAELEEKIDREFSEALIKINEAFNQYFQMMFDGGGAKLIKTAYASDQNNEPAEEPAAEEVLEIKVDLPRKKIKSLDMLSGGERALTSIALLFGIIATSPPPFLILDEIDAALDEANSLKFARLLKDLTQKTQFILITHNRQTMNEANVLYGVTMGSDGVSRLLSLKLEEAEEISRQYKEKS